MHILFFKTIMDVTHMLVSSKQDLGWFAAKDRHKENFYPLHIFGLHDMESSLLVL